jgi:predicted nucleic acid-binding protein
MARSPTLAVVDASVVVKWFKTEEHFREALALRNDWMEGTIELYAPELLPYEVLNALRYDPSQTKETLKEAAASLIEYQFQTIPFSEMANDLTDNVMRYGITVYDAAYLTTAQRLGTKAYTSDEKLIKKVAGDTLQHISTYPTRNPQKN